MHHIHKQAAHLNNFGLKTVRRMVGGPGKGEIFKYFAYENDLPVEKMYLQKMENYFNFLIISLTIVLDFAFPPRS